MELILLIFVMSSLAGSFTCSLCEAALYAVTPSQVETLRCAGMRESGRVAILRSRMHDAIAGIASVNTITQTVGAAWAGTLASRLAWAIQSMIWLVWPLARWLTHAITRRAPSQKSTEKEILVMADLAAKEGEILPDEWRWVENVLRLNDVTVRHLMTSRNIVFSLPAHLRLDAAELHGERLVHSRIKVTEGQVLHRIVGVVQRRTLFDHFIWNERGKQVRDIRRPALIVSEDCGGHQLLDRLTAERQHLAAVTSAGGCFVGVATLEVVVEYLLGKPIVGEHDSHPEMQQMALERARFHADGTGLTPDS